MGSEVSDRTVLQDEHLLRAAERNHSMCDRIGTQHVLHDQSLHLRGEFVEYKQAIRLEHHPSVHHTLPLSSRQLLAAHDVDRGRFPALTFGMTSPVSGSSVTFSTTDSCSRKSLKTEIPLWSRE